MFSKIIPNVSIDWVSVESSANMCIDGFHLILSNKNIDKICNEFKIHLVLHYIDDDTTYNNHTRKITCNFKKNIGVCKSEAVHNIEMNLYRKHYFLEEKTCFYI